MFLPIGDAPNPRPFTPVVTYGLIAVNVAIYLLLTLPLSTQGVDPRDPLVEIYLRTVAPNLPPGVSPARVLAGLSAYDLFVFNHGYKPGAPELGDLLAAMFLHGGFMHLAGNMLFLWIFGDNVEHRLGRVGYLVAYLVTGLAATVAFALFAGDSMVPLVGASGAISGVLGIYFLLFPRNKVKVFVALFPIFFDVIFLPARVVLGIYIIVDNLLPFVIRSQSSVAYGAHLGGFAAGLLIAFAGERFAWRLPWRDSARKIGKQRSGPRPVQTRPGAGTIGEVRRALADDDPRAAIAAAQALTAADLQALDARECIALAGLLEDAGHPVAASRILRRCLARGRDLGEQDLARVYLALGLSRLAHGQPTAAYQHLLAVFDHRPDPETAARARSALGIIGPRPRA